MSILYNMTTARLINANTQLSPANNNLPNSEYNNLEYCHRFPNTVGQLLYSSASQLCKPKHVYLTPIFFAGLYVLYALYLFFISSYMYFFCYLCFSWSHNGSWILQRFKLRPSIYKRQWETHQTTEVRTFTCTTHICPTTPTTYNNNTDNTNYADK
jgi:hypothetical protein